MITFRTGKAFALQMDANDPLSSYRDRFHVPRLENGEDCIYFAGHSLGLLPKKAGKYLQEELHKWRAMGVEGYFRSVRPWLDYHEFLRKTMAKIVGAQPIEVTVMNSLTVNLHLLMVSFFRPTREKYKIMIEGKAFPSDQYAIKSQLRFHRLDPKSALMELQPRKNERILRTEDILSSIEQEGDSVALILFGGVNYYTGQAFDMETITRAGHAKGCTVGFDLAHAAGNVLLKLHDWDVDFAAWCTYKYLNGGPGSVGGIFVHERHSGRTDLPRFAGWWGHNKETRFDMPPEFDPIPGAEGWQVSNSPIFSLASLLASLEIFAEAGMEKLRQKSERLTGYLEFLLNEKNSDAFDIITPRQANRRGSQLSIRVKNEHGQAMAAALNERGVRCDFRQPDVIRVAPAPLYNRYQEVLRFTEILKDLIGSRN